MSLNKTAKFKVNGIHCNGCATKIKNSINSLEVENQTDIDVAKGEVKVSFDGDKAKLSDIKTKIIEVGYKVEGVELE